MIKKDCLETICALAIPQNRDIGKALNVYYGVFSIILVQLS
ncbi:hypothetical protein HMPREF3218_0201453 [Prevotella bivia]|nr:hypothetical protein HMPREF3218_0201453 [Prevotella bivia]